VATKATSDYAFPVCDAVDRNPNIKWIGCSNELNASYAADGYARVRGAAMLSTTYAVGELSAINGVMGAKAERSLVFHVVGMPCYQNQRLRKTMHHTFGDGAFGNFVDISAQALAKIGLSTGASRDRLSFATDLKKALAQADFVRESALERSDLKIIDGVLEEAGDRSIEELERERDDVLRGLLALRARSASAVAAK
jgi:hypothetical protein